MKKLLAFAACFGILLAPVNSALAVEAVKSLADRGLPVANVLQGEDIDLPQEFVARLDDGKLKVALDTLGIPSFVDSARANLIVRLIGMDGTNVQARTNAEGVAEFAGVTPDILHAVVVNDQVAHAAIPVMPISAETADAESITSDTIKIPVLGTSREEILKNVAAYTSPNRSIESPFGRTFGVDRIGPIRGVYTVRMSVDGLVSGRIVVPDTGAESSLRFANITILQGNQVIAQTTSNTTDGVFSLVNMRPGSYGLIAAGPAGYAAYAFEVLPNAAPLTSIINGQRLIAANVVAEELIVFMVPPELADQVTETITQDYTLEPISADPATPTPTEMALTPDVGIPGGGFPGGGFPGGGFPGGAGGGGSGLAGGLNGALSQLAQVAPLIALGGIAAAVASDNNDEINTIVPVASSNVVQ